MKLYWSSRSPFVRKVMATAHEVGVATGIRTERVVVGASNPNVEVMAVNPLNKIPTLVLDDGTVFYDSRVICEYFDTLHAGRKLFPPDPGARFVALRRQALGDGLMEVILLRLGEQARPPTAQSEKHLATHRLKIATVLDRLESEADGLADQLSIGHIAIGCALSHLDFRFAADDWRAGHPQLARWFGGFAVRPSMQATQYVDAY
jgi:glutathione S-transferase